MNGFDEEGIIHGKGAFGMVKENINMENLSVRAIKTFS